MCISLLTGIFQSHGRPLCSLFALNCGAWKLTDWEEVLSIDEQELADKYIGFLTPQMGQLWGIFYTVSQMAQQEGVPVARSGDLLITLPGIHFLSLVASPFPPTDSCTSQINCFHPNPNQYLTFKIMWSMIFFMYSCCIIIPKRIIKKALNLFSKFKILKIDRYSHYLNTCLENWRMKKLVTQLRSHIQSPVFLIHTYTPWKWCLNNDFPQKKSMSIWQSRFMNKISSQEVKLNLLRANLLRVIWYLLISMSQYYLYPLQKNHDTDHAPWWLLVYMFKNPSFRNRRLTFDDHTQTKS